jgi:hypothetical protein
MVSYVGGQDVKEGCYLNLSSWEFENVTRGHGCLPGNGKEHYNRVPSPLMLVAGPLTGLVYIAFLPVTFCVGLGFCFLRRNGEKLIARKNNFHVSRKN